jgi:hypothetical protein
LFQDFDGDVWITVFSVLTPHAAEQRSKCDTVVYNGRPVGNGYHQTLQGRYHFDQSFVVDPEAVAYYLCVFPRDHSKGVQSKVSLYLTVSFPRVHAQSEQLFGNVFSLFGVVPEARGFESPFDLGFGAFKDFFHLGLLRALASELNLGLASRSDDSRAAGLRSLSKLFAQEGFATEKKRGLECLVELIDSILILV